MSTCNALIRTPEDRRYLRRCQQAVAASLLLYIACSQASLHFGRTPLGFALSALGSIAIFGEIVAVALITMKRLDEFQRVLMIQSFLWATVLTMFASTVYGMLELHSHGELPRCPVIAVPGMQLLFLAFIKLLIFRRHKSPAE